MYGVHSERSGSFQVIDGIVEEDCSIGVRFICNLERRFVGKPRRFVLEVHRTYVDDAFKNPFVRHSQSLQNRFGMFNVCICENPFALG